MFLGAGETAFIGAGAIPAPVSRSYKSNFLGAGKGPARVIEFSGAGQGIKCPWKQIFRGGSCHEPPLKMDFSGAVDDLSRPWKCCYMSGSWHNPPLKIIFPSKHFQIYFLLY